MKLAKVMFAKLTIIIKKAHDVSIDNNLKYLENESCLFWK